jgi:sterol 14-demethylase
MTHLQIGPVEFIADCYKHEGPIFTVPMFHKRLTFLIGPEVSAPFYKLGDDLMSQPEVYGFMTPVFGKGVVYDAEPKKRMQQMQHMAKGLRSERLKKYVPKIEMETLAFIKKWGERGELNLLDALSELTILTSSRCLHGDDVRENMFNEVAQIYHDLDKGVTPLSFFFPYAPTAAHALRDKARKQMVDIFSKVIKERRAKAGDTSESTDILQVFMDIEYKDGTTLKDDEIVGLLIALLFAGQHTSSITSTWTLMLLLHNPDCLDKVLAEQDKVLASNKSLLDFDVVGEMEYLQNATKESLRMFPPLIMLMRMAMADIETSHGDKKFLIPKGTICITSPGKVYKIAHHSFVYMLAYTLGLFTIATYSRSLPRERWSTLITSLSFSPHRTRYSLLRAYVQQGRKHTCGYHARTDPLFYGR